MKKASMSATMLVLIVITAVSIIPIMVTYGKVVFFADELPQDIFNCQQSAILSLQVGDKLALAAKAADTFDFAKIPFVCPVRIDTITTKDLGKRLSSKEKREYTKLEYQSKERFNFDSIMWTHMQSCYEKMFYGESSLFGRDIFASEDSQETMCVICSIIEFDEEVKATYPKKMSFSQLLRERNVPRGEETLLEKSQNHPEISDGFLLPSYSTDSKKAMVYFRTNKPKLGNLLINIENAEYFVWDATIDKLGLRSLYDFDRLYVESPTYFKDFESIAVINYDDASFIENECTTLAAQLESAQ